MDQEPALIIGVIVALVILVAGKLNIVLDDASVTEVVTPVVVALLVRFKVVPADAVVPVEDPVSG